MSKRNDRSIARTTKGILIVVVLILAVMIGAFIYFIICCPCNPSVSDGEFGDDYLNGTYHADAMAITYDGGRVAEGVESSATIPTVVFLDDFEGTSPWTFNDGDVNEDAGIGYLETNESAYFDPVHDGSATLSVDVDPNITIASDETLDIFFYVNASPYDDGDGDYFILEVAFSSGKTIVYEIIGDYSTANPDIAVIDVSSQLTAPGIWAGINVENIDDDYIAQFGGSTPVPTVDRIGLDLASDEGEAVYVDEFQVVLFPRGFEGEGFWREAGSGEKVTSYFVEVYYNISVNGSVNENNTHAEIKLWMEVYDDDTMATKIIEKTLIQDDIINYVVTGVNNTWTSKVFSLPESDEEYGSNLYYVFSIKIEAWGALVDDPGTFLYASNTSDGFDAIDFDWITIEGGIDVIIYVLGIAGPIGCGAGILAVIKKRKKSIDSIDVPRGRETLFN